MVMASGAPRPSLGYQPALDGIRALAVVAVLLFHGEVPFMTGGYLGVSVFFTLSGFLITSLLLHEHERTGRIAVGAFFARRARRLLPASLVCLGFVAVAAATTDWFAGVAELRRQILGSLLHVANWVFLAGDGSYQELFQQSIGSASPLEHYWSLAIEEQFYWLWPVAFIGLVAIAPTRRRMSVVLGAATVAFAACAPLIAVVWGGDAAYWATPARAAEILVGAVLAVVLSGRRVPSRWSIAAPVALAALAAAFVLFPAAGGPAYSGALPLVGVVSAALLLGLQVDGPVVRALAIAPAVWLGRISYGVYLYHWPIFVVVDEGRTGLDGPLLLAVRLALTLAVAQVSFTLVEQPLRHARPVRSRRRPTGQPGTTGVAPVGATPRRTLAVAGAATVVAAGLTVAVVPGSDSDYWVVSEVEADAARLDPAGGRPLVPLTERDGPDRSTASPSPASPTPPTAPTTGPENTAPPTTVPEPTVPATTVPGTTVPETTLPETTVPETTVPETTVPAIPEMTRPVRIVVSGDSTAEATGVGLLRWAAGQPELAQVAVEAEQGCGFVRGGDVLVDENWIEVPSRCGNWLDSRLPDAVADAVPDVVMLTTTSWDVLDHRWQVGEQFSPLDPEFRERLEQDFADVTDGALAQGAGTVAWIVHPVPNPLWLDLGQTQQDPARHDVLYDVMRSVAADRPGNVEVVDLAGWLAERGHDRDPELRPDGVHWSPDASEMLADEYLGDQLVRVALGLPRP